MISKAGLLCSGTLMATAMSFTAGPAAAQARAAAAADDLNRVSEVVVTARRTEESLQETPVAVTAVTSAALQRNQVLNVFDIKRVAPNLAVSVGSPSSPAYATLTIRGQTNIAGQMVNDPAIGLYVDGVYMGRMQGSLLDMIDTARVEVLRGPQGTLFGRNTTGGAVSITTNAPTAGFEGSLSARLGNYDLREVTGVLNAPIVGDDLIFRGVFRHTEHSGYGHNAFLNRELANDDGNIWRAALKYAPSDSFWVLTLAADHTRKTGNGSISVLGAYNPLTGAPAYALANAPAGDTIDTYLHRKSNWWTSYSNEPTWYVVDSDGYSATLNVDLGLAKLKSISAWRSLDVDSLLDSDGTPYLYLTTFGELSQDQVEHELQLTGTAGKLDWIVGGFYFKETGSDSTKSRNYLSGGPAGPQSNNLAYVRNTSLAGYAQANYHVTDKLTVTGGLRQTYDKRGVVLFNRRNTAQPSTGFANPPLNTVRNCNNGFPNNGSTTLGINDPPNNPAVLCQLTLTAKFDYLSYLLSVDYKLSDSALIYAKTSRAFLAGGWNTRGGAVAAAFAPEEARDVEVGAKVDWFDGRLRTNVAVFHSEQRGVQRSAFALDTVSGLLSTYTINAGSAHVDGFEVEVTAVPWTGMEVAANLGVTDAKYDRFFDQVDSDPAPGLQPLDRTDEDFPAVPRYNWSVGATQRIPSALGEWALHLDYAYISSQRFYDNTANPIGTAASIASALGTKVAAIAPGYGLLNGQVALDMAGRDVTLAIWGRNLLNEKFITRTFADTYSSIGTSPSYVGDPRTYGATLTYRF